MITFSDLYSEIKYWSLSPIEYTSRYARPSLLDFVFDFLAFDLSNTPVETVIKNVSDASEHELNWIQALEDAGDRPNLSWKLQVREADYKYNLEDQ